MPIRDQSYQHWRGELRDKPQWSIITRNEISRLIRRKFVRLIVVVPPLIYLVVHGVLIYIANYFKTQQPFIAIDPSFFKSFLLRNEVIPGLFIILIGVFSGASLIADDLRSNALQIYLSKPISWIDYIFGKIATMIGLLSVILFLPSLILLIEHLLLVDGAIAFLKKNYWIFFSLTIFASIMMAFFSVLVVALSSLTTNSRYAAVGFVGILIGTPLIAEILQNVTRRKIFGLLSIWTNLDQIGSALFDLKKPLPFSPIWSLMILVAILGVCVCILQKRIRPIHVIK